MPLNMFGYKISNNDLKRKNLMKRNIIIVLLLAALACISCVSAADSDNATDALNQQDTQDIGAAMDEGENEVLSQASDGVALESPSKADSTFQGSDSQAYIVLDNDADKENIYVGDYVTWKISAENKGPATAKNVKVFNQLPKGLKYVSHHLTNGKFDPKTGIWDIGDLSNGSEVFLYIKTLAVSAGEKVNKAKLTSDTDNLNDENYEEEEIDVFDHPKDKHNIERQIQKSSLRPTGNPVGLILLTLLGCFAVRFRKL